MLPKTINGIDKAKLRARMAALLLDKYLRDRHAAFRALPSTGGQRSMLVTSEVRKLAEKEARAAGLLSENEVLDLMRQHA